MTILYINFYQKNHLENFNSNIIRLFLFFLLLLNKIKEMQLYCLILKSILNYLIYLKILKLYFKAYFYCIRNLMFDEHHFEFNIIVHHLSYIL